MTARTPTRFWSRERPASAGARASLPGPRAFRIRRLLPDPPALLGPPPRPRRRGGAIRKPRSDTVRSIHRELAQKTLGTLEPTKEDIREALELMKRALAQGHHKWAEKVPKFEAWLAKAAQADRSQSFGHDHLPPSLPTSLADILPPGAMHHAGAPAAKNPVAQLTSLFKTPNQRNADANNAKALFDSVRGRGFGAYPLLLNGVPLSCIARE